MSTHSSENWPKRLIRTLSPRFSVLEIADSQAPEPDEGNRNTRPLLSLNAFLTSSNSGKVNLGNSGERMSSMRMSIAERTASGTLVGPGMNRCVVTSMK